jgi:hypothetical protein
MQDNRPIRCESNAGPTPSASGLAMDLNEPVRLAAVIVQAVAIVVTAGFAVLGLQAWRRQLIGKRKVEIAEQTLLLVYKIRNAIAFARLPVHGPKEGLSRPREVVDDEDFRRLRDSYFVPVERLRSYDDDFAQLERQRLLCEVYFGHELRRPLIELAQVRGRLLSAARQLLASAHDEPADVDAVRGAEAVIWDYGDPGDTMTLVVEKSVAEIENVLRRYLKS